MPLACTYSCLCSGAATRNQHIQVPNTCNHDKFALSVATPWTTLPPAAPAGCLRLPARNLLHMPQESFEVVRSVNRSGRSSKSGLSLSIAGQDLTAQEQRLTEQALQARFSASLLPKTLVFTQEDLLALLQV